MRVRAACGRAQNGRGDRQPAGRRSSRARLNAPDPHPPSPPQPPRPTPPQAGQGEEPGSFQPAGATSASASAVGEARRAAATSPCSTLRSPVDAAK